MDYPPEDDYDSLLQEELDMIQAGEMGYAASTQHQQYLTEEEEQEILQSMQQQHTQQSNANQSIGMVPMEQSQQEQDLINISATTSTFGGISGIAGAPVNRNLFGAVSGVNRITSTPFIARNIQIADADIVEVNNEQTKRRARFDRDIFGADLYENDSYNDPVAKKMKIEEENDLEIIEKILALRQRVAATGVKNCKGNVLYLQRLHEFKMKNLSYAVPQWPFLQLRRTEQERIFVRFHSADYETRSILDINAKPSSESLLGECKQRLWSEANELILKRAQQRSSNEELQVIETTTVNNDVQPDDNLWVEKYKPRKYLDLLSAEMTNRSLLLWLKMWDKIVFGKDFTPKSNLSDTTTSTTSNYNKLSNFNKRTGKFESNGGWFQRRTRSNLDTNADEHGRPAQKVALVHGAPGLGKTTLAHILAKHAGYQPLEINASDDRSPAAFQQALENGTQMSSLLNEDRRPNCIILDEIDGAPRQSIEFLVKFVSDNFQSKQRSKAGAGGKAKKSILRRPIICICNDVYEPALRSLRLIAFIVQFPPIQISRLEERLKQIAKLEKLKADITALYALAQKTGNDVRSCISTLQFFKAENKPVTLQDIAGNSVSRKDQHQGLFAVWGKIFQIQRTVDCQNSAENGPNANETARVRNILHAVQSAGDYQRLMNGVYENFLNQKLSDSNFNGIVDALQWFCFYDKIQQKINQQQNYAIYPYLQFGFAKWHLLFATLVWPKINFPTQGIEVSQKSATQRNIFESLQKGMLSAGAGGGVGSSFGLDGKSILLEAVPFLKRIISPELRHMPIELFSQRERQDLRHTVEVMADLGLNYVQVKSLEGTYQFQMEPDLEALVKFSGFPGVNLSYFGRQMLAREIEIERIHRAAPKVSGPLNAAAGAGNVAKTNTTKSAEKQIPNHLRKLQPKMPVNAEKLNDVVGNAIPKYFGNILLNSSKQSVSTNCSTSSRKTNDPIVKSPIWYHYKEGFNNAVRKDIHMKELL